MVRAGLRQFLEEDRSITEIGEAASGNETLDQLRAGSWDLVILDINMPDRSGLDILRYIRASYPDTKVLVLSGFPERQYAINVLKAGAGGYLPKECAPEELLKATRAVHAGAPLCQRQSGGAAAVGSGWRQRSAAASTPVGARVPDLLQARRRSSGILDRR